MSEEQERRRREIKLDRQHKELVEALKSLNASLEKTGKEFTKAMERINTGAEVRIHNDGSPSSMEQE